MFKNTIGRFNKYIAAIFPFKKAEILSVWPILILGFCIGFNYTILKDIKDSIIITASKSGAEIIPFIKVWGVVPGAIVFTFIYTKLSNKFRQDKVCYIFLTLFLAFFTIFSFILFPLREKLHLHTLGNFLESILPSGLKGFVSIIRYWSFSFFYILAEMWSSIILSIMYWRLINSIYSIKEAKSVYALFGFACHISGAVAGQFMIIISSKWFYNLFTMYKNPWQQTLSLLSIIACFLGFVIYKMYKRSFALYLNKTKHQTNQNTSFINKKKKKTSFLGMIKKTLSSQYLSSITILVLAYNICINLTEVLLKHEILSMYPNTLDFNRYMNKLSISISLTASIIELFFTKTLLKKFGWKVCALITPIIMIASSSLFFPLFIFKNTASLKLCCAFLGLTPLALCTLIGSVQNILCRGCKFSLFDCTKEMTFIPLSYQEQYESKSIIDGVGSRIGKSGGSLAYQGLLIFCSSISGTAPFIGCIVGSMSSLWILGIHSLWKKISIYESETKNYCCNMSNQTLTTQHSEIKEIVQNHNKDTRNLNFK